MGLSVFSILLWCGFSSVVTIIIVNKLQIDLVKVLLLVLWFAVNVIVEVVSYAKYDRTKTVKNK